MILPPGETPRKAALSCASGSRRFSSVLSHFRPPTACGRPGTLVSTTSLRVEKLASAGDLLTSAPLREVAKCFRGGLAVSGVVRVRCGNAVTTSHVRRPRLRVVIAVGVQRWGVGRRGADSACVGSVVTSAPEARHRTDEYLAWTEPVTVRAVAGSRFRPAPVAQVEPDRFAHTFDYPPTSRQIRSGLGQARRSLRKLDGTVLCSATSNQA